MKKTIILISGICFSILTANIAFSQTLQDAIKLTESEQFEKASAQFTALIQKEPTNGENYFYLGENYFRQELLDSTFKPMDFDSTLYAYTTGLSKNPGSPFNYVGKGKVLWYSGKYDEAKKQFYDALQIISPANKSASFSGKQKATIYMKIAECYIKANKKDLTEANNLLAKALNADKKNPDPDIYILMGDAALEQNTGDASIAITNYKKAYELDKKSCRALLRIGQLYNRARNLSAAVKSYDEAIAVDPNFAPAYREKAEAYYRGKQYETAILNYKKYLELNSGSLNARVRYASFLFLSEKYNEAIAEITEIQKQTSSISFLYRLLGYSYFETGKYAEGTQAIETFLQKTPEKKILPSDYEYYGKLLSKAGKDSLAIEKLNMAISKDTSNTEIWGELGSIYLKAKKYPEAITAFNKKINSGKNVDVNDYYQLCRSYFYDRQFSKADSAALQIITLRPDISIGYLWRARSNAQLDPKNEKFLARPFYEEYLSKLKPEELEKNKQYVAEASECIGYYYMTQKEYGKAKCIYERLKTVDPGNKKAKEALSEPHVAKAECS